MLHEGCIVSENGQSIFLKRQGEKNLQSNELDLNRIESLFSHASDQDGKCLLVDQFPLHLIMLNKIYRDLQGLTNTNGSDLLFKHSKRLAKRSDCFGSSILLLINSM